MIQVAGEALIDLVMQRSSTAPKFVAHVGGAPLNAAVALGRLDVPVRFACPISCDAFAEMIHENCAALTLVWRRLNQLMLPRHLRLYP